MRVRIANSNANNLDMLLIFSNWEVALANEYVAVANLQQKATSARDTVERPLGSSRQKKWEIIILLTEL